MRADQFAYWLMGFFELCKAGNGDVQTINAEQTQTIKQHLSLVFLHDLDPKEATETGKTAEELQKIHDGPRPQRPRPPGGQILRC